ncbi:hypothetical protein BDR07DRAFT_1432766 [Suillus spraguei]|nr:hypothetical protein BDR07DRAFT_1432766 [Suillus spraguei]
MCRIKTTAIKKLSNQQKQPCTALKCAKCLQAGQSPDRKCCTTLGCPCRCPRFIGIPTQRLQKGEQCPVRMSTRSQTMIKSSTSSGDVSSMNVSILSSSSDEGDMEDEIPKTRGLQTYSIPGSLLVTGAMPLAITLQHCAHTGSVMILPHPIK